MTAHHLAADPVRVLAKILRDVLAAETFTSDVDVKDALKSRCARLRVPYDAATIDRALALVASNRALSTPEPPAAPPPVVESVPLTRADAADVLARLRVHLRSLPSVRELTPVEIGRLTHDAARARALWLVLDAIAATSARCDALESEDA